MSTPPRIPSWITDPVWRDRYARWTSSSLRAFHRYAGWLVSLSWWRFAAYAAALQIGL